MGRYPRTVRDAQIKCITCNAPVVQTVENAFVCVGCGESPVNERVTSQRDFDGESDTQKSNTVVN